MSRVVESPRAADTGAIDAWELAYLRFETPEQEVRKFRNRLIRLGAERWPREWIIADLFCGRSGGAHALQSLGFRHVVGLDISERLVSSGGRSQLCARADCRIMPLKTASVDVAIVQGGLHHLPRIPSDLESTLDEVARILRPGGLIVAVEPWRTPFLDIVHRVSEWPLVRRASPRVDALATMIEHERPTYEQWLRNANAILELLSRRFDVRARRLRLGKLYFIGARK